MLAPRKDAYRSHFIPEFFKTKVLNDNKSALLDVLANYIANPAQKQSVITDLKSIQAKLPCVVQNSVSTKCFKC